MSPFSADSALRLGASVSPGERPAGARPLCRAARTPGLSVELCDAQAVGAYEEAWQALAARALEPNVFLEPGFALPAARHFPPAQRPLFLLVWREAGEGRADLVGLLALRAQPRAYGLSMSVAWTHEQATGTAPLLDPDQPGAVLDAMLDDLAARSADWSGLLVQGVALEGPTAALLAERGRRQLVVEQRTRTVLRRSTGDTPAAPTALSRHHAKELRRQRRRLADEGPFAHRSARSPEEIRLATEAFLALEARGWKGARGSALLNDVGLAAFTRAMTRQLGRAGLCRIDTLEVGGEPAAMGIVLRSGDRAFYWKTAYDERWRRHSPGKQLAGLIREAQDADPAVALTDSCAVPDHQMIAQVWPGEMTVADVLVGAAALDPARLARAARAVGTAKRLRAAVKSAYLFARRTLAGRRA